MNVSAWWRTHPWFAASDQHDSSGGKMRIRRKEEEKTPSPPGKPTNLPNPTQTKEKG